MDGLTIIFNFLQPKNAYLQRKTQQPEGDPGFTTTGQGETNTPLRGQVHYRSILQRSRFFARGDRILPWWGADFV